MGQRIEWVTDQERFSALADRWDELARSNETPFGDHAWFAAWWDAFGSDGALRICVLWRGDDLCAALPLMAERARLAGLANYHTPVFSVPSRDQSALAEVVEAALAVQPSELAIHAIRASDPVREAIATASARSRRQLLVESTHRSPLVNLDGDFDSYVKGRGRRFKDIPRRWRKVNREHEVLFRSEDSIADLDGELRRGFEVEAAGWKGQNGTAILSTPQATAFYTALANAYHARGGLLLGWLEIDEEPSAFNFCLLRNGRLFSLKSGYDERFRRYAPGLLLDFCTIEHCFERGLKAYDLLGSEESYKAYFANSGVDHVRIRSYRRRPLALTRYVTRRFGRPIAHAVRNRLAH